VAEDWDKFLETEINLGTQRNPRMQRLRRIVKRQQANSVPKLPQLKKRVI